MKSNGAVIVPFLNFLWLFSFFQEKESKNQAYKEAYNQTASWKPRPEIFVEDSLHMNAKGYAIWKKAMEPYLRAKSK